MKTLKDLFLNELADLYDAERRTVQALPKMAWAATCNDLTRAMLSLLKQTEGHVTKLEQVFECFNQKARGKMCEANHGLRTEGDEIAAEFRGSQSINAALIATAQKIEHHAMASCRCLHEWAGRLGNHEAAALLHQILDEEKAAQKLLSKLACASSNKEELGESTEAGSGEASEKKAGNLQFVVSPRKRQPKPHRFALTATALQS